MTDYEFTLKFKLPLSDSDPATYIDALAEAGCDDAMVGIGKPGRIALDFTRSSKSAYSAISSALRNVRKAIPGATLVEASPDFVGLTDVAEIAGFSRQNMRKLMVTHIQTFPAAVHDGKTALWHLATVLAWLAEKQDRRVDPALLDVARTTMTVNIAKEARQLAGAVLPKNLEQLFA